MLGLHARTTLRDVLHGTSALDDVLIDGPRGIKIAPAASGFEEMARLGGAPVEGLVAQIAQLAPGFDVALIDTAAGLSPAVLGFVLAADQRLIVATPEPTSVTDAYAMMKVCATRYGQRSFELLINMARSRRDARATHDLLSRVCGHFLDLTPRDRGFLPWDPELPEAVRRQRSVLDLAPRAAVSLAIQGLAAELCREDDGGERPATLFRAPLEEVGG
jgi:flagellar biosynthesis protein FlhG